jgi:hypothetical protein
MFLLGLFRDRVVQYFVKIWGFAIRGLIMKICAFAICGLAHLRLYLRISDSGMSRWNLKKLAFMPFSASNIQ